MSEHKAKEVRDNARKGNGNPDLKDEINRVDEYMDIDKARPLNDFMLIEKVELPSPLIGVEQKTSLYTVKDIGPGNVTDNGMLIRPKVNIGDKVFVVGTMFVLKTRKKEYYFGRARDVIAVVS